MASILDYSEGTTALHRANPLTKVALAICICAAVFLAQEYCSLLALLLLVIAIGFYAGIGAKTLKLAGAFVGLGVFMFLIQTMIVRDGKPLVLWITDKGLDTGLHVALRLVTFALPLVLMLSITRLNDLANAAVEKLHVPYRYAFTITTALRFVPIFSQEMNQIMEAQTARGVEFDSSNPLKKLRLMMPLAAPLLIGSVAKADDTALAAEERGFYLRSRESSYKRYPFRALDVVLLVLGVAIVVLGALF